MCAPIFVRDEGYRAFVNRLRADRGLPALSMDDMATTWECFDVGGLVPQRPAGERADACAKCGAAYPIEQLDAKPDRLAGRSNTNRQLKKALHRGEDFDRLECEDCYGPGFAVGATA